MHVRGAKLLFVFAFLSFVVPIVYNRWISVCASFMILVIFIFMLYAQSIMTVKIYHKALDIACYMSIICFTYAIIQKIIMGISYRSTGGLLNANYYGTIIELVVIIAVYRMITNPHHAKKYIPIIAINIIGLFLCDCQSAWIAMFVGVLFVLYFNGYKKQALIFLIVASILIIVGIMVPGVLPRWGKMPQTYDTRLGIWCVALKGIKAHPIFGQGMLTYLFNYDIYGGYKTYHAHSLYLDPILSHGIVGVAIIITYIITVAFKIKNNLVLKECRYVKSIVIGAFIAICVHGFTDFSIQWIQTGMLFAFLISGAFLKNPLEASASTNKLYKKRLDNTLQA